MTGPVPLPRRFGACATSPVTTSRSLLVGPQPGVVQQTGQVTCGNYQDVPATAQDAVQRGQLAARTDLNIGHALAGSGPAPAAIGADQGSRWVGDVDVAEPADGSPLDHRSAAQGGDDKVADPAFDRMADGAVTDQGMGESEHVLRHRELFGAVAVEQRVR